MIQLFFNHPLGRTISVFSLICVTILLLAILLSPILVPLILSFALYALLEPLSEALERQGFSRSISSLTVLLLLVSVAAIVISVLLPHLAKQLSTLQSQLPGVWQSTMNMGNELFNSLGIDISTSSITQHFFTQANDWGSTAFVQGSNILISLTVFLIFVPIITFFLVRDYHSFRNYMLDKLPNSNFEMGWLIYHRVAHQLQEYIRGIMIQSSIMCVMTSIGFYIIGLDSPFLLGATAGVLNLIPYVGPLLATVLPILMAISEVPIEPWLIGAAISVILIAQIIDSMLVIPSVIASAVNLHPLIVIMGIIVFGNLFGFIGMVIATPTLSTANIIYRGLYQGIKTRSNLKTAHATEN